MALAGCSRAAFSAAVGGLAFTPTSAQATRSSPESCPPLLHRSSFTPSLRFQAAPNVRSRKHLEAERRMPLIRGVAMQEVEAGDSGPGPKIYPPGLGRYESMIILRPDITEEERQALTERYEETLVGTGALDVELFNRGMQPLNYPIKKRSTAGLTTKYLDGWYLLFTFVAKPEAIRELQQQFKFDDDIIRAMTFNTKM